MDKKVLDEQRPGSDLHGLIEKVAFLVWMSTGAPSTENWEKAKGIILDSGYAYTHGQVGTPEEYHRTLEWTACNIGWTEKTDMNTSWYKAQEHWAEQIFNHYTRRQSKK